MGIRGDLGQRLHSVEVLIPIHRELHYELSLIPMLHRKKVPLEILKLQSQPWMKLKHPDLP